MPFTKYDTELIEYAAFGNKNSYREYGMVLVEYDTPLPKSKTFTFTSQMVNGKIDYTDLLTESPSYDNTLIKLIFKVVEADTKKAWKDILLLLATDLNGKWFDKIYISPIECTFKGRLHVNSIKTNEKTKTIAINIDAYPEMYMVMATSDIITVDLTSGEVEVAIPTSFLRNTSKGYIIEMKSTAPIYLRTSSSWIAGWDPRKRFNATTEFVDIGEILTFYNSEKIYIERYSSGYKSADIQFRSRKKVY